MVFVHPASANARKISILRIVLRTVNPLHAVQINTAILKDYVNVTSITTLKGIAIHTVTRIQHALETVNATLLAFANVKRL